MNGEVARRSLCLYDTALDHSRNHRVFNNESQAVTDFSPKAISCVPRALPFATPTQGTVIGWLSPPFRDSEKNE